jgi:hypothetical protein
MMNNGLTTTQLRALQFLNGRNGPVPFGDFDQQYSTATFMHLYRKCEKPLVDVTFDSNHEYFISLTSDGVQVLEGQKKS